VQKPTSTYIEPLTPRYGGNFRSSVNPGAVLLLGYVIMILVGFGLLSLPWASHGCSFIDALFTSTSATCVTGLIVKDTPQDFTFFGQIVILVLIQIGGLGYMTFSTLFFFILGQRTSISHRVLMKESINSFSFNNLKRFAYTVVRVTLVVEGIGALILSLWFRFAYAIPWQRAIYHGIFQSISAFCNAGFSSFSDNLAGFTQDPVVGPVIAALIIAGGLGFLVISDMWKRITKETLRLTTHTKLVLTATIVLIIAGTVAITLTEWNGAFKSLPAGYKILNGFFTSVTSRTAGFNLTPMAGMHSFSLLFLMLFMFIGASPGGTGGGVKTTAFSLLLAEVARVLRGRPEIVMLGRTIKPEHVYRAITIIALSTILVLTSSFLLIILTHGRDVLRSAFETISAFGTVGLSRGSLRSPLLSFAADFNAGGKVVLMLTMLFGKLGTLTVGSAILAKSKKSRIRVANANIVVG
jgi:trk system potassium uptake protein TrkH